MRKYKLNCKFFLEKSQNHTDLYEKWRMHNAIDRHVRSVRAAYHNDKPLSKLSFIASEIYPPIISLVCAANPASTIIEINEDYAQIAISVSPIKNDVMDVYERPTKLFVFSFLSNYFYLKY
ncbi:hypothetical protein J6590_022338 [Homalodisca vitripennis]|nr:hypothetical protein J6590_022338 [Homalodisca vitripennis]